MIGLDYQKQHTIDSLEEQSYVMILLQKLKKLLNALPRFKKDKGVENRASVVCDACGQTTQYFVVSLYKSTKICMKSYEEDTWLARVKQKEAITKGGF